jgi:hypothetical protein
VRQMGQKVVHIFSRLPQIGTPELAFRFSSCRRE